MSDWQQDFLIQYELDGHVHYTIWSGYTREGAVEEFERMYPERRVIEVENE